MTGLQTRRAALTGYRILTRAQVVLAMDGRMTRSAYANETRMVRTGYRAGYWIMERDDGTDACMGDLVQHCAQSLVGRYVVIASCDSGSYTPTDDELTAGWRQVGALAISPKVETVSRLPTPGFDEWYVYDRNDEPAPHLNFVNRWGFSVLNSDDEHTAAFWDQITRLAPLHVLGAGCPTLFLVTRDEVLFKAIAAVT
jgi:hypothetical protein